ncbi:N-acetyl-gamma-glutamyl-phosphate reductase [Kurthia sibirica]|uniref:N-acetyl-gamma-glutamyl-phosphate reductase n=1 Tax=Kurthia sibirica TaxID=202750 RepID=A0A2U3AJ08_9BACL|nr:N-acetyl-gamma-glutamyl-phosphate reductase [Kurthia sibirica]PWI24518.1 N-acetyl-gamma-glutamyl-phosphate reductase [Kurthia sibirica]GEK33587.1 N-acetyl-gamma-glutamyl-phosphate reductase [Kurthia sibirica]
MKVGIIGATGYGGLELIRLLHSHQEVQTIQLFTSSEEGVSLSTKYPHLTKLYDAPLEKITKQAIEQLSIVFLGTPSGVSGQLIPNIYNENTIFIDLSGDLRLKNSADYEKWYGKKTAPEDLLAKSVYGLCSWNNDAIRSAKLIANPGCYPTAVLLSLLPLLKTNLISHEGLIIDAKSGVSGSGNKPSQLTHYAETTDATTVYKINKHQHIPEIEQAIKSCTGTVEPITFTTHLVPMVRGIITTSYAKLSPGVTAADLHKAFTDTYSDDPFIRFMPDVATLSTKQVKGTNFCDITFNVDDRTNRVTIVAVIDNLVKGAAGQAIQNMNLIMGFNEKAGLQAVPLFI